MKLLRSERRPLVIGHRGARAVAPENTLDAFAAAVEAGADVVEFDVSPGLLLGHSPDEMPADPVRLERALAFLAERGVGVHVDVKQPGYEQAVVDQVRAHGLADRSVISTALPRVARTFAALAPDLERAIGYPRDRYGVSRVTWPRPLTRAGAASLRAAMPARIPLLLRRTRATALSLHHTLCSGAAVAAAHRRGAPVLVWTVDDPAEAIRFASLGVDAIVSDDPGATLQALATLRTP